MFDPMELMERIRLLLIKKRGPKRVTRIDLPAAGVGGGTQIGAA
jgi:hypothetical protein